MFINDSKSTSAVLRQTTESPEDKTARGWIALAIMLLALFGHTLVFVAFYRERNLRTLQNIININLSVADFLFSTIVPSTHVVRLLQREETLSEIPCCCRASARQHTILDVTRSSCFFVSSSPAELYLVEISICAVEMSAIPGEN